MATRKRTTTRSTSKSDESAAATSEPDEAPTASFERAYYGYVTTVTSAIADPDLQEQITEAANDCMRTYYDNQLPQEVWLGLSEAWERASSAYGADDVESAERMSTVSEASNTFSQLLAQAQQDRQDRLTAAYSHYEELVRQAPHGVSEQATEAFHQYVGDLRNAWSTTDVEAMGVEDLMAIGQSVVQVCAQQLFVNTTVPH